MNITVRKHRQLVSGRDVAGVLRLRTVGAPHQVIRAMDDALFDAGVMPAFRLGVPELVRSLRARLAWMQQRRLLSAESPPHQLVDVLLTLVHGVAFMNLVTGQVRPGAASHLRRLIEAVIGPVTPRRSRQPAKRVRQAKVDRSR